MKTTGINLALKPSGVGGSHMIQKYKPNKM